MDIEWAKDADDGRLYILQARPETVHRAERRAVMEVFSLTPGTPRERLAAGAAIGQRIGVGPTRLLRDPHDLEAFQAGEVLVASMTDPDWEPIMKRAAAIVTDRGGRTCHAAIVSRELGVPCVVGTGNGTEALATGQIVTVSCAEGETGSVYRGALPFERRQVDLTTLAEDRDQGDAQRGQSRRGLPAGRAAQRRRRARPHRVHHRAASCASIRSPCSIPSACATRESGRRSRR